MAWVKMENRFFRKIQKYVKKELLLFDKDPVEEMGIIEPDFSIVKGNHIVVITPSILKYVEQMFGNLPMGINAVSIYAFTDVDDVHEQVRLLEPDFCPVCQFCTQETMGKNSPRLFFGKYNLNGKLLDRMLPIPRTIIVHKNCKCSLHESVINYVVQGKMFMVVVDDEFKMYGIVDYGVFIEIRGRESEFTFGMLVTTNFDSYTVKQIVESEDIMIKGLWGIVVDESNNKPICLIAKSETPMIGCVCVDLNDSCNLLCPGCGRGLREMPNTNKVMTIEDFDFVVHLPNAP